MAAFFKRNRGDGKTLPPWKQPLRREPFPLVLSMMLASSSLLFLGQPMMWLLLTFGALTFALWYWSGTVKPRFFLAKQPVSPQTEAAPVPYPTNINDPSQPLTPKQFYAKMWQMVSQKFLYDDELSRATWKDFEHAFDDELETIEDAGLAMRYAMRQYDRFGFLEDYKGLQRIDEAWRRQKLSYSRMESGNVAYVRLATFEDKRAVTEMRQALERVSRAEAYILDLRGNLGGFVVVAAAILSLLLDEGTLVTLEGKLEKGSKRELRLTKDAIEIIDDGILTETLPRQPNMIGKKPLVILVNHWSASASELVAAALSHHAQAMLVGERTFGKGVGQSSWLIDFGAILRLTTFNVYNPNGECIHGRGLFPDVGVVQRSRSDDQFRAAHQLALYLIGNGGTSSS
jgi:hypothetical protein